MALQSTCLHDNDFDSPTDEFIDLFLWCTCYGTHARR